MNQPAPSLDDIGLILTKVTQSYSQFMQDASVAMYLVDKQGLDNPYVEIYGPAINNLSTQLVDQVDRLVGDMMEIISYLNRATVTTRQ